MINKIVSIVIPTKNSANFLEACFQSIKNQTYKNIEIIVVDNNSTDNTKEIAKKYTNKVYNKGPERSSQKNFGAKNAKGKYLFFMDSDMELSKKVVEDCMAKVKNYNISETNKVIGGIIIPEKSVGEGFWAQCKALERSFYVEINWIEAARFFPKNVFNKLKGYDENLVSAEDWDLNQSIKSKYRILRIGSFIYHNEGKLKLTDLLEKKLYYGKMINHYEQKKVNDKYSSSQLNIIKRYKLFFSHPVKLFKNPIIGFGMLFMKTVEFIAGGIGYLLKNER